MLSAKHFIELDCSRKSKIQNKIYPLPNQGTVISLKEIIYTTRGDRKLEKTLGNYFVVSYTEHEVNCKKISKGLTYNASFRKSDFRVGLLRFVETDADCVLKAAK